MAGYEYWDACGDGITEDKARAAYDEMLDHVHGEFMGITASEILSECDPIAYRVGFNDFVDLMLADGEWFEQDPTADDDESEDDD